MNKQLRLSRLERLALARLPAAGEYGPEAEARIVKRLTEALTEHGGPEGLQVWLEGLQEARGPSRLGVDWDELNENILRCSLLLWRDMHGNTGQQGIDHCNAGEPAEAG